MVRAFLPPLLCLLLMACAQSEAERANDAVLLAKDPVIARALHDPLMSDPDLASRNEANAILGQADSSALPVLRATPAAVRAAREAIRLELLEGGPIPDLPPPARAPRGKPLGPMASAADLIAALGAPASCAAQLREDFMLAADLPPIAAILPQGMVLQAGGADAMPCRIRIIRYTTPAVPEDALQYHYTRALRGGLKPVRHTAPEDVIAAAAKSGETLVVHVRPAAHGMTGVDLLYRAP